MFTKLTSIICEQPLLLLVQLTFFLADIFVVGLDIDNMTFSHVISSHPISLYVTAVQLCEYSQFNFCPIFDVVEVLGISWDNNFQKKGCLLHYKKKHQTKESPAQKVFTTVTHGICTTRSYKTQKHKNTKRKSHQLKKYSRQSHMESTWQEETHLSLWREVYIWHPMTKSIAV